IFLRDIDADYAGMNAEWDAWVAPGAAPARATVQARLYAPEVRDPGGGGAVDAARRLIGAARGAVVNTVHCCHDTAHFFTARSGGVTCHWTSVFACYPFAR